MAEKEFIKISPELRNRRHFGYLLNCRGIMWGMAIEIGTDRGDFAKGFLDTWRGPTLFCVDPYDDYPEMNQPRVPDYDLAIARLAPYVPRVRFYRAKSMEVAKYDKLPGRVVFVYIDGTHTQEAVTQDCEVWWEKLNKVGILAGHDWDIKDVRCAVEQFGKAVHRTIYVVKDIEKGQSWYMYKAADTTPLPFDVGGFVGKQGDR